MNDGADMKTWPRAKRIACLRAEMEARLAALRGGAYWRDHGMHVRDLAALIWDIENERPEWEKYWDEKLKTTSE